MGGKADVAAISSEEQLELDILPILETGQMLNFIEVKSGDVQYWQPAQGNKRFY